MKTVAISRHGNYKKSEAGERALQNRGKTFHEILNEISDGSAFPGIMKFMLTVALPSE